MGRTRSLAAPLAAAAALAAVSACGSSGGSTSTGDGLSAAQHARSGVVSAAQGLAQRLAGNGLAADNGDGQHAMRGQYTACADSGSELRYGTYFELSPVGLVTGTGGSYKNQVTSAMTAAGWKVTPLNMPPGTGPFAFDLTKSGITGEVSADSHPNAVIVSITLHSGCVDAGSSAGSLETSSDEQIPLHT